MTRDHFGSISTALKLSIVGPLSEGLRPNSSSVRGQHRLERDVRPLGDSDDADNIERLEGQHRLCCHSRNSDTKANIARGPLRARADIISRADTHTLKHRLALLIKPNALAYRFEY